jgi:hypothetical protein
MLAIGAVLLINAWQSGPARWRERAALRSLTGRGVATVERVWWRLDFDPRPLGEDGTNWEDLTTPELCARIRLEGPQGGPMQAVYCRRWQKLSRASLLTSDAELAPGVPVRWAGSSGKPAIDLRFSPRAFRWLSQRPPSFWFLRSRSLDDRAHRLARSELDVLWVAIDDPLSLLAHEWSPRAEPAFPRRFRPCPAAACASGGRPPGGDAAGHRYDGLSRRFEHRRARLLDRRLVPDPRKSLEGVAGDRGRCECPGRPLVGRPRASLPGLGLGAGGRVRGLLCARVGAASSPGSDRARSRLRRGAGGCAAALDLRNLLLRGPTVGLARGTPRKGCAMRPQCERIWPGRFGPSLRRRRRRSRSCSGAPNRLPGDRGSPASVITRDGLASVEAANAPRRPSGPSARRGARHVQGGT